MFPFLVGTVTGIALGRAYPSEVDFGVNYVQQTIRERFKSFEENPPPPDVGIKYTKECIGATPVATPVGKE